MHSSLRRLALALDGQPPEERDWFDLIALANKGWLAPALHVALERSGSLGELPEDVRDYLALLHSSNRERNRRLRDQLVEAVAALNSQGVEPIILKGAVHLLTCEDEALGERMIGDIDLSIEPSEMTRARAALLPLGYANATSERELARAGDVGLLELHLKPGRRSARYLSGDLRLSCTKLCRDGAVAWIPSATARALHLIVHDMIKEGDYWRLRLDLRHLKDLADLARSPEGVRWEELRGALGDRTGRRAFEAQLIMLNDIFRLQFDGAGPESAAARRLHRARLAAIGGGHAGALLRGAGNAWWALHRTLDSGSWRGFRNLVARGRNVMVEPPKGSRV